MCKTDEAILFWLRNHRTWPPEYPRRAGLLANNQDDPVIPREEWGVNEWRAYAQFLEESGASLVRDLVRFENELREARGKLTRKKVKPNGGKQGTALTGGGLLWTQQRQKPGRKPSNKREVIAAEILAVRGELQADGKRITDKQALAEWLARNGKRRSRVNENRNLLNAVSEYRKKHNISKR